MSVFDHEKAFFTTTNVYLARVNLNIAITAMVIEKQPQGNHSSVVCEREYEIETSSSDFNTTFSGETEDLSTESLGHDTFDWTNRQSGLMLGMGLRGLSPMMDFSQMSAEPR